MASILASLGSISYLTPVRCLAGSLFTIETISHTGYRYQVTCCFIHTNININTLCSHCHVYRLGWINHHPPTIRSAFNTLLYALFITVFHLLQAAFGNGTCWGLIPLQGIRTQSVHPSITVPLLVTSCAYVVLNNFSFHLFLTTRRCTYHHLAMFI